MDNSMRFFELVAGTALSFAAIQTARADIVYAVDITITSSTPTGNPLQTDTIDGTITTDGTIGVIGQADIAAWNLDLIDGLNSANDYTLTQSNSLNAEDTRGGLTATATALSFDFSGSGEFLIQALDPGVFSGFRYFCLSTGGACLAGETIAPGDVFSDGVVATPAGKQPLNPSSTVPEPSTCGVMLTGLLCLGGSLKRRFL